MKSESGFAHLLALLVVLAGIILGVFLVTHPTFFNSRASSESDVVFLDSHGNSITSPATTQDSNVSLQINYYPDLHNSAPSFNGLLVKTAYAQNDPPADSSISCNGVSLSATPNSQNPNQITFGISGDASTYYSDSFSPSDSVSSCSRPLGGNGNSTCNITKSGTWTRMWRHCVGDFNHCSSTCTAQTTYNYVQAFSSQQPSSGNITVSATNPNGTIIHPGDAVTIDVTGPLSCSANISTINSFNSGSGPGVTGCTHTNPTTSSNRFDWHYNCTAGSPNTYSFNGNDSNGCTITGSYTITSTPSSGQCLKDSDCSTSQVCSHQGVVCSRLCIAGGPCPVPCYGRCTSASPSPNIVGLGAHCEGFIQNPPQCASGLTCVIPPGVPGDVGGTCQPNTTPSPTSLPVEPAYFRVATTLSQLNSVDNCTSTTSSCITYIPDKTVSLHDQNLSLQSGTNSFYVRFYFDNGKPSQDAKPDFPATITYNPIQAGVCQKSAVYGGMITTNASFTSDLPVKNTLDHITVAWNNFQPNGSSDSLNFTDLDAQVNKSIAAGHTPILNWCEGPCFPSWANQPNYSGHNCAIAPQNGGSEACRVIKQDSATLSAFDNFNKAVIDHFKDRVHNWEYGLEPNNRGYSPVEFTNLLKRFTPVVRSEDPNGTVIAGHLGGTDTSYLQAIYEAGGGPYFDKLSIDPYGDVIKNTFLDTGGINNIRQAMIGNGDSAKKIILGEWGVTSCGDSQAFQNRQASLISQGVNWLSAPSQNYIEAANLLNFDCDIGHEGCQPTDANYLGYGLFYYGSGAASDVHPKVAYNTVLSSEKACVAGQQPSASNLSPTSIAISLSCASCVLNQRPDVRTFYQSNGYTDPVAMVDNWCNSNSCQATAQCSGVIAGACSSSCK